MVEGDKKIAPFILKTTELHALLIGILDLTVSTSTQYSISSRKDKLNDIIESVEMVDDTGMEWLGSCLVRFFSEIIRLKDTAWSFIWPLPDRPEEHISAANMGAVADIFETALHSFIFSQSWSYMLSHMSSLTASTRHIEMRLSRATSHAIQAAPAFHRALLEFTSGASVRFEMTSNRLLVIGDGKPASVRLLRDELKKLMHDCRGSFYTSLHKRTSAYFMTGANCIFVIGCYGGDVMVKFIDYFGPAQLQHRRCSRGYPVPVSITDCPHNTNQIDGNWMKDFISRFEEKIITQLSK